MPPITSFFRPPPWSRANKNRDPERVHCPTSQSSSRPLSSPPSTFVDLTYDPEDDSGPSPDSDPDVQLDTELSQPDADHEPPTSIESTLPHESPLPSPAPVSFSVVVPSPTPAPTSVASALPPAREETLPSAETTACVSSFSSTASQRIVKDGKEVVISSDGEDTDSDASLEDPDTLFAPTTKQNNKSDLAKPKRPIGLDKARLVQLSKPKKYQNTIDSLVSDALDDDHIEEKVAKAKAAFARAQSSDQSAPGDGKATKKALREDMLTSALGDDENQVGFKRLLDAVRRTEALDSDRVWHFLEPTQMTPAPLDFPTDIFAPGTNMAAMRDPDSRVRVFQSGILEFAASLQRVPEVLIHWLFCSIPLEPRDELRRAYCRVIEHTSAERLESLIRPGDIDYLFQHLGAKPQALDLDEVIAADSPGHNFKGLRLNDREIFTSIFGLFRDASNRFALDTRERAIHFLLRMAIDTSLMSDSVIRSDLESALSALLNSASESEIQRLDHQICSTLYATVKDVQLQSRMLSHVLPTSTWISLLRCRLAVSFLLQSPAPLKEPPETLLDLKRITVFLARDQRFNMKLHKTNGDYDYGDLFAICTLLEIVINSSLYDMQHSQADAADEFNTAVDKLAAQINKISSSIEDTGASHLKRMLAKEALEALHYRIVYSVRSKPPPMKLVYSGRPRKKDGNIRNWAQKQKDGTAPSTDPAESTAMPIRGH